jgi:signal recognition particle receptor subunit beta
MDKPLDNPEQTTTLRMVFDSAPLAGKTTAAYALSEALGVEAETPADAFGGRTLWFDWMNYTGGRHEGKAIRVELVTVPGQSQLNDRRRYLLGFGDVIVFIVDSSALAFPESVSKLNDLRADLAEIGSKPVIYLANKRDVDDALAIDEMRDRLGLDDGDTLIEAVATNGGGMRQAFIFAVRAALADHGGRAETTSAAALLAELEAQFGSAMPSGSAAAAETADSIDAVGNQVAADGSADTVVDTEIEPVAEIAADTGDEQTSDAAVEAPAAIETETGFPRYALNRNGFAPGSAQVFDAPMWQLLVRIGNGEITTETSDYDVETTKYLIEAGLVTENDAPAIPVEMSTVADGPDADEAEASESGTSDGWVGSDLPQADHASTTSSVASATAYDAGASLPKADPAPPPPPPAPADYEAADSDQNEDQDADLEPVLVGAAASSSQSDGNPGGSLPAEVKNERYRALRELRRQLRGVY